MEKTALASAIALSLGISASAHAATITIDTMVFGGTYAASGTMNDTATGVMQSIDPFYGAPWTATQQTWFDTHTGTVTWAGDGSGGEIAPFTYTFTLTGNQVAAGVFFDWTTSDNIPVLTIYDCPVSGGGACSGNTLPMATAPFPGTTPAFNGTTADDFPVSGAVPVPAAVWLFGSGLVGLVGVARRRKRALASA